MKIMPTDPRIIQETKREQARAFRIALDPQRYNMTLKAISADAAINYDSLGDYASGKTEMPLSALRRLCGVLPTELLSIMLPGNFYIKQQGDGIDHADIAQDALEYIGEYSAARHPASECGIDLGPNEMERLANRAVKLRAVG